MRVRTSLRNILTVNYVVVGVLPIVVIGVMALHFLARGFEREITQKNYLLAKSVAGEVERFLDVPLTLFNHLGEVIGGEGFFKGFQVDQYLETINNQYGFFNAIHVIDQAGIVRHAAPMVHEMIDLNVSGQPFYRTTMTDQLPYWSPTFISMMTGEPTLVHTKPIRGGMIAGYVDLSAINSITSKISVGQNGYAAIVDRQGTVIAHPDKVLVQERVNIKNLNFVMNGLAGKEGAYTHRFRGGDMLSCVAVVQQTGWLVLISQPTAEAFSQVHKIRNIIWIGAAISVLFALVTALASIKQILAPVSKLVADARKIANGEYTIRPQAETYSEINELADDFRIMAEAVEIREKALRESEERYRALIENSPFGISLVKKSGAYAYINPKFTEIFGYTLDDIPDGKTWFRKAFPDSGVRREVIRIWVKDRRHYGVGESQPRVCEVYRKDGRKISAHFIPVTLHNGDQLVFYEDVTEKRQLEVQFQAAQRMEALGTLAGGIAHNYNNVLLGIQGRISLMTSELNPTDPNMGHLTEIEAYVKSAADLTSELLGFARGGKYEVKPIDLNDIIKLENRMFGKTKKEIKVTEKLADDLWTVEADEGQIRQVLMNLYVNACQAMPRGGDLCVQTQNFRIDEDFTQHFETKPGRYVKISVTDTGIGMDPQTCEKIFEPFFTTRKIGRGTGLGLASVYGIIKNHGGLIMVNSQPGEGTTFELYLPASSKKVQVQQMEPTGEHVITGNETVLLVDDEKMVTDVGNLMLQKLGYRVMVAGTGEEAIEVLARGKASVDIVILDMIMPGLGGGDTFDRLKEIDPHIKVLLSSGYSLSGQANEIMERGCDGFIQKPFNLKDLSHKIRLVMGDAPSAECS